MTPTLRAHEIEDVPAGTRVRHYDELAEDAKETFPSVADGGTTVVSPELATRFRDGEVVKFTRYYRIEVLEDAVRARANSGS
ncbi:MAG: hypothetical protein ABEJ76_02155 [Halanaeroarchaeum sp.]